MATRVLIVDDHLAIREGIRSLLAPETDFVVVGEAVDGNDGIQKAIALKPDLIVLDNSMPGRTGLEVARELKTQTPDAAIVFLTLDPGIRDLALAVGAVAHISKDTPPQEMLKVLRTAAQQQERRRTAPPELTAKERELGQALLMARVVTEQQLDTLIASRAPRELLSAAALRSKLVPEVELARILSSASGRPLMKRRAHRARSVVATSAWSIPSTRPSHGSCPVASAKAVTRSSSRSAAARQHSRWRIRSTIRRGVKFRTCSLASR
jgi:two-component system response regulator NreC